MTNAAFPAALLLRIDQTLRELARSRPNSAVQKELYNPSAIGRASKAQGSVALMTGSDSDSNLSLDGALFIVLVNGEDQHSIWPASKPVPDGWTPIGEPGTRAACIELVEERWLDMRPLSLRRTMDGEI